MSVKHLELDDLVRRLAPVARPIIVRYFIPNCCIATCAILKRVFAAYGFHVEPIPTTVMIFNERMLKALERPDEIPPRQNTVERALWFKLTGAYGIGIMPESAIVSRLKGYDGFGGHLILRVQDMLVDASIAQASRPEKNMSVPALVATTVTREFMQGQPMGVKIPSGAIQYQRLKDNSYRTAPDWREWSRMLKPVDEILRRLDEIDATIKGETNEHAAPSGR